MLKITKIVMHTQDGCPPCAVWKREELPKAQADGVPVEFADADSRGTPAFDATYCNSEDGTCHTHKFSNVTYEYMKNFDHRNG